MSSFAVAFSWITLHLCLVLCANNHRRHAPQKSCLDHLKSDAKLNGIYLIVDQSDKPLKVYCDLESELNAAWTLILSWFLQHNDRPAFKSIPLVEDVRVNDESPNWVSYRQSKTVMDFLKSQSSNWRATCSFNERGVDYRDYVRSSFKDFDVTTFYGQQKCKMVDYINIRGHAASHTTVAFWQMKNTSMLYTDSSSRSCLYGGAIGGVPNEDNFGYYQTTNKNFRCTSDPSATTQYWFGGYV